MIEKTNIVIVTREREFRRSYYEDPDGQFNLFFRSNICGLRTLIADILILGKDLTEEQRRLSLHMAYRHTFCRMPLQSQPRIFQEIDSPWKGQNEPS